MSSLRQLVCLDTSLPARLEKLTFLLGIDDEIVRRDSLHAVINSLPDPNYATLRALVLVSLYNIVSDKRQPS
jgi:hypothetical protein